MKEYTFAISDGRTKITMYERDDKSIGIQVIQDSGAVYLGEDDLMTIKLKLSNFKQLIRA